MTALRRPARAALVAAGCALLACTTATAQTATVPTNSTDTATTGVVTFAPSTIGQRPSADAAISADENAGSVPAADGQTADPQATGTIDPATGEAPLGEPVNDRPIDLDLARMNLRQGTVDGLRSQLDTARNDAPGVSIGTLTLKPTLSQSINHETTRTGKTEDSRAYLETRLKGTLTSDWSRHQLTITGEGAWQRNVAGTGETEPVVDIDADLRLDIGADTTGHLRAGYHFEREDQTDPNAINAASVQSGIDQYTLGASIERDFGILRGSAKVDFDRYVYGSAELSDGSTLSTRDRNRNAATLTTRVGYELSPALVPFLEASVGGSAYDMRLDSSGYGRSYRSYAGRGGVAVDLGEKLSGELALGYGTYQFDDNRLGSLSGITLDGIVNWSPRRGTTTVTGIATTLEPSTTAGDAGAISYKLSNAITHELRSALVARLSNSLTYRNYPAGSLSPDQTVWFTGAGLTWDLNRYLALTGDVSYERTMQRTGSDTSVAKIGVGLSLRR